MQDSTRRLIEYLYRSATGDSKISQIRAIVDEREGIGCAELIQAMSEAGLPPGTIAKAEQWCDDPNLVLPRRERKSTMDLVAEGAREHNTRERINYVEPTQPRP